MKIVGIQYFSTVDYPGKISATVFLGGCNYRCGFCHNPSGIDVNRTEQISMEEFTIFLEKRKKIIEGIVICGGEPTIHSFELIELITIIKSYGYCVKLDTNGSNPELLNIILSKNLLDYIAMDVKAPLEKYDKITRVKVDINKILRSIELIKNSNIEYEFRTTLIPELMEEDISAIADLLKGAKKFVVQQFRNDVTLDPGYKEIKQNLAIDQMEDIIKNKFDVFDVRGK